MRRSTFTDAAVTYAAIGGTLAPDLMSYPPRGHRPLERTVRLGSGEERFRVATASLMTWGIQRGSGIEVTDLDAGTGVQYTGIVFTEEGTPAASQEHPVNEAIFADDGTAFISNGMTAILKIPNGPFTVAAPVRVVYVIDEPDKIGFAYGTMRGHPQNGEECFIVDRRADDSVWLTIRSFSRPSTWYYRLAWPFLRFQQERYTRRYLLALHPVGMG